MIRVRAPSRLHFGLLSLSAEGDWPTLAGETLLPARQFGGVGLMVDAPGLELSLEPASAWSAEGPLAERALCQAQRVAQALGPGTVSPKHILIRHAPPEHVGLGAGTQLGMAVARGLTASLGLDALSFSELARLAGRGTRSALGVHGFMQGGFLVEAGKRPSQDVSPLIARLCFPEEWRLLLVMPVAEKGPHGADEAAVFRRLQDQRQDLSMTEALCRLVLLGLLPALVERDLEAFGEALYDFNARVGATFAAVQGGLYTHAASAAIIAWLRKQGLRGVGQSSWGPTVFVLVEDPEQGVSWARRIRREFGLEAGNVICTAACNQGAKVEKCESNSAHEAS